jgi:hypothetical protein
MARYRKLPVEIDAMEYKGPYAEHYDYNGELLEWIGVDCSWLDGTLIICTKEGNMTARPGDWIIKGVKGEFYPCKPDIFAMTYEKVEDMQ